jgi:hypothetical protein
VPRTASLDATDRRDIGLESRRVLPRDSARRAGVVATLLLVVFAGAFTVRAWPTFTRPFTSIPGLFAPVDSYNNAVFSIGARALREHGPIESKLGGDWGGGDYYADHPPLIYSASALTQAVVGDDELAAPLLAFAASVASVALLFGLLRQLGVAAVAAAVSVIVGLSVAMFLDFGTMLDTLILGLPFAVGYLVAWQANLDGRASPRWMLGTAAAVVLVAWEGAILVATSMVVTWLLGHRRYRRMLVAAAGGLVMGLVANALWIAWVSGLETVLDKALYRSGRGSDISIGGYLEHQGQHLRNLFGIAGVVVLAMAVAACVCLRRFRPLGAATLATVLMYALAFREGSDLHDYWNYWLLIPFVLGVGALATLLDRSNVVQVLGAAVLATALVIAGFQHESPIAGLRDLADRDVAALAATRQPALGQQRVLVAATPTEPIGETALWVLPPTRYYLRVPLRYASPETVVRYVERHPNRWVVVNSTVLRGRAALSALGAVR